MFSQGVGMPTINRLRLVRATLPNRHFRVGSFPPLARALPHSLQTRMDPNHGNYEGLSFAVAQVKGQNLYVGVEEYADYGLQGPVMCPGKMRVALRTSADLIHWSARIALYDGCQDYANFGLKLPEFVNESSTSNTQIDLNNFYIVGNKPFKYYYMRVGLTAM